MSSFRASSGRSSGTEPDVSPEVRDALARIGRTRANQGFGVTLLCAGVALALGERGLRPGGVVSVLFLGLALAAAVAGVVLANRSAPLAVPEGAPHDPSVVGELALAAMMAGGTEREMLLDVLSGALAYQCARPPRAWDEADLRPLRGLLSRSDPTRLPDGRFIETALGFFAVHGGPNELQFARWLTGGHGGSRAEAAIRQAARKCAERMEQRLAGERQAGTLVRPASAPDDTLLRPAGNAPVNEGALLRPAPPDEG